MSCPFVSDVASLVVVILQHEDVGGGNPFKDEFIKPSDDLPDNLFDNSSILVVDGEVLNTFQRHVCDVCGCFGRFSTNDKIHLYGYFIA